MAVTDLYEKDFYAWANETAQAIRSGDFSQIDLAALAEEVAAMPVTKNGPSGTAWEVLIAHLLRWDYLSRKGTSSRAATIARQRSRVLMLLKESPSLAPSLSEKLPDIYGIAVKLAVSATNLREQSFPPACPYTLDEILSGKSAMI